MLKLLITIRPKTDEAIRIVSGKRTEFEMDFLKMRIKQPALFKHVKVYEKKEPYELIIDVGLTDLGASPITKMMFKKLGTSKLYGELSKDGIKRKDVKIEVNYNG